MEKINKWEDIEQHFLSGSLILGNGASIAVSDSFNYDSLYLEAQHRDYLNAFSVSVFKSFKANDFEFVLRNLLQAKQVNQVLNIDCTLIDSAYINIRDALIRTLRDIHISYSEALPHLPSIYNFMRLFKTVASLNYDLIVYWAAMLGNHELGRWFKDCFTPYYLDEDWEKYLEPIGEASGATLFFYPHGNLVLHREDFLTRKIITRPDLYTHDLLNEILSCWEKNAFIPVFVCEGRQDDKVRSISNSSYLDRVFYEVLPNLESKLVIYGWSIGQQDQHIIEQIKKAELSRVAVSVFREDKEYMERVKGIFSRIGVQDVIFFDAESPGAWNNPSKKSPDCGEFDFKIDLKEGEKLTSLRRFYD